MPGSDPRESLVVEVTRGSVVESRHDVAVAVTDSSGAVLESWGDVGRPVPVRSSIKALQAIPLVASGAADALAVSEPELAIACGSHSGEPDHIATVRGWLDRLGLSEDALQCGASWPLGEAARSAVVAAGGHPSRAKHNCSGKHVGFLSLSAHIGADPSRYLEPAGEVQGHVLDALAARCGLRRADVPLGVDGCGAPVMAMPLTALATGVASVVGDVPAGPATRIVAAMSAAPWYVAGSDRLDTILITAMDGDGYTKVGAEGVQVAGSRSGGFGIACKVADGARRATDVAIVHLLARLGVLDLDALDPELVSPPIRNSTGEVVGHVRMVGW